ncbi:hypothetical protein D9757_010770 [Collybiopsis confluens]|uniref:Uncharacterized protein n=1 Tax=Collybiopsis confluens TaxID=2823264 RepID=A0A8H5H8M9_9AGAR|nr:hypothetical protein D9757_010770 [Collybiopsis confluens]
MGEVTGGQAQSTREENGSVNLAYHFVRPSPVYIHPITFFIAHPHPSISESSFYKHIDPELPDTERLRLLLTWCASRAENSYTSAVSGTMLPPLTAEEASVLQRSQGNIMRMLVAKQIDLSPTLQSQPSDTRKPNEKNVSV